VNRAACAYARDARLYRRRATDRTQRRKEAQSVRSSTTKGEPGLGPGPGCTSGGANPLGLRGAVT